MMSLLRMHRFSSSVDGFGICSLGHDLLILAWNKSGFGLERSTSCTLSGRIHLRILFLLGEKTTNCSVIIEKAGKVANKHIERSRTGLYLVERARNLSCWPQPLCAAQMCRCHLARLEGPIGNLLNMWLAFAISSIPIKCTVDSLLSGLVGPVLRPNKRKAG